MGCWNHTCALTNIPVSAGEPVVVMLLVEHRYGEKSHCYPNNYYQPLPLYFTGNYNDYGAVEDCEGPTLDLIVDAIKQRLVEMDVGENKYHDIEVKKDGFNVDKLFEADHEGRLRIANQHRIPGQWKGELTVKHIVIRKNVFDQVMSQYVERHCRYDRKREEVYYVDVNCQTLIDQFVQWVDVQLTYDNSELLDALELSDSDKKEYGALKRRLRQISFDQQHEQVEWMIRFDTHEAGISFNHDLMRAIDYGYRDLAVTMATQIAQTYWLNRLMIASRRMWIAPSGSGSQDDDVDAQTFIANITIEEAKRYQSRWDEEDEE